MKCGSVAEFLARLESVLLALAGKARDEALFTVGRMLWGKGDR